MFLKKSLQRWAVRSTIFNRCYLLGFMLFKLRMLFDNLLLSGERSVEYPWLLRNIRELSPRCFVLDVGCAESFLSYELLWRGFTVFGVGISSYNARPKKMIFTQADVRKLPFRDALFDVIIIISTIEHIGVGLYENKLIEENADYNAMSELKRIIKSNGKLLLTTPFKSTYELAPGARLYDMERLQKLSQDLTLMKVSFFVLFNESRKWRELSEAEATQMTRAGAQGLVCLVWKKSENRV